MFLEKKLKRFVLLIILLIISFYSTLKVIADVNLPEEPQNKQFEDNKLEEVRPSEDKCIVPVTETMFNYTKSTVDVENISGVNLYTINQNGDTRYNMGYALGKSVSLSNESYAKDLRLFIDNYKEHQSIYNLDDVVEKLSKSVPCMVKLEMQGFADAVSINKDSIVVTYEDIVILNTVVLWTRLPKKHPQAPPPAPTSVTPLKKHKGKRVRLSEANEISNQYSLLLSLDYSTSSDSLPVVARTYSRKYFDFFNRYPCVFFYQLDNISFYNVGFVGLFGTLSGINEHGIIISTIQALEQVNIKIIGATPPTISARIALEAAVTTKEALGTLMNYTSCLEQSFLIADSHMHRVVNTSITGFEQTTSSSENPEGKFVIQNYNMSLINQNIKNKLNYLSLNEAKISLNYLLDLLSQNEFYDKYADVSNKDDLPSVFNVVFSPEEKYLWVLMPTELSNKFVQLGFNLQIKTLEEKEKEKKYYEKYLYDE